MMRRKQHRPRYAARPHLTTMRARPAKTKRKRSSRPPRRISRGLLHARGNLPSHDSSSQRVPPRRLVGAS